MREPATRKMKVCGEWPRASLRTDPEVTVPDSVRAPLVTGWTDHVLHIRVVNRLLARSALHMSMPVPLARGGREGGNREWDTMVSIDGIFTRMLVGPLAGVVETVELVVLEDIHLRPFPGTGFATRLAGPKEMTSGAFFVSLHLFLHDVAVPTVEAWNRRQGVSTPICGHRSVPLASRMSTFFRMGSPPRSPSF